MPKEMARLRWGLAGTLLGILVVSVGFCAVPAQPQNRGVPRDAKAEEYRLRSEFDLGAFCIADIPLGRVEHVSRPAGKADGAWREVTLRVREGDARKPRIFFFGNIRRESGLFSGCGEDLPPGVSRILEGKIVEGTLRFRIRDPLAGFTEAFEIDDKGLDVVIRDVGADFPPLYGGKVTHEGIDLKASNLGRFVANPGRLDKTDDNVLDGQLSIGSYGLALQDAKLRLPGGASELQASFGVVRPDGVALKVEVPSGKLSLYKGFFRATAFDLPAGPLTVGGADFDLASGHASTLDLVAQEQGGPLMRLGKVSLTAETVLHPGPPFARLLPAEPVTIAEVVGPLGPDDGAARLLEANARDLRAQKALIAFGGTADRPSVEGQGTVELAALDAASLSGEARLATPDLRAAKEAVSDLQGNEVTLHFKGPKSALELAGQLQMSATQLRTLSLSSLAGVLVGFDSQTADGELGLRFSVDTSSPTGRWSFVDPAGATIMLEGALRQLKAAGSLWLGSSAKPARLQVDPNTFRLVAGGTAVRETLAFGARPEQTSLSAEIDLRSASGFTVTKTDAEGRVELATNVLAVTEPSLTFSESETGQFRLLGSLRFKGGATLGIRLADLAVKLIQGQAVVENLGAEALTTDPIRFADLEVTAPKLTLERLEIDVRNETGTVKGRGLVFDAKRIKHTADPQWEVNLLNPRFPEIEATLGSAKDAVTLEDGIVRDLAVQAASGFYRSRDGFTVSGEGIDIRAARISESAIEQGRIAISQGEVRLDVTDGGTRTTGSTRFEGFEVTADGPKDDIAGKGRVHLADLQIHHYFPILKEKECRPDLQLRASLGVGAVDIDLRLERGEVHGNARVNGPRVRLSDTSDNWCEWNDHWNVDVVKIVLTPVCWIPFLGDMICKEVKKHIKVQVRVPIRLRADIKRVDIRGSADHVDLNLRGARGLGPCVHNAKLDALGRVQLFSVRPTFQASGAIGRAIKDAFDLIVGFGVGVAESAFVTSHTNFWSILSQAFPTDTCI